MDQPADAEIEVTTILYGAQNIINFNLERFSKIKEKHDAFLDSAWPSVIFTVAQPIKTALMDLNKKGIKQRLITEITSDNVAYCKELIRFTDEIRHLAGIKGNFSISDEREYVAIATIQKEQYVEQLIFSNAKQIVEQHQYLFETLWDKAIPADNKIKEIEQGIKPEIIETTQDPIKIQETYQNLIKSATNEVMLMVPTSNAVYRQSEIGMQKLLKEVATGNNNNNVNIRILAPIKNGSLSSLSPCHINLRNIETASATKSTIIIVDRRESLVIEVKDDSKDAFANSIGFATYSNSRATVLSYISIFETFWLQSEMIEKLKRSEELQKQFISIASHELRNPIQPIIGLTEILRNRTTDKDQQKLQDIVIENAKKLKQLSDDVLDITRIENQSLNLHKEHFNLNDLIQNVMSNLNQIQKENKYDTRIEIVSPEENLNIYADRNRIYQVVYNLLDNAIKFTNKERTNDYSIGQIIIALEKKGNDVIVSFKDNGKGIDSQIFPKLFEKFVTRSTTGGTGLGLFISKNILEAHGGNIWAKNNENEKGATFSFSLPLVNQRLK